MNQKQGRNAGKQMRELLKNNCPVYAEITVRPARLDDKQAWVSMMDSYARYYHIDVSEDICEAAWFRIMNPEWSVGCLIANNANGDPIGMANYILHPSTFSTQMVCYLEDLFVFPEERRKGAAAALVKTLESMGRRHGWRRLYWNTMPDNKTARILYDKVAKAPGWIRYEIPL
jgi:GNAT superfamily N-acetyltransferase